MIKGIFVTVSVIDWHAKAKKLKIEPDEFLLCILSQDMNFLAKVKINENH